MIFQESHQTAGRGKFIIVKLYGRPFWPAVQFGDPGFAAHGFYAHDEHQRIDLFGQRPKTVDQLSGEALQLNFSGKRRQPTIQAQAHIQIRHIGRRDQDGHPKVYLRRPLVIIQIGFGLARPDLGNRVFQHLLIEFIAHVPHLT